MRIPLGLIGAGVLGLVAAALVLWPGLNGSEGRGPRAPVDGGDGGGLPRVPAQQEHLDPAALEAVSRDAAADELQALIVLRHDYIVFERYGHGVGAETMIDSGAFARALVGLATGIAAHDGSLALQSLSGFDPQRLRVAIEAGARQSYPQYLSLHLWRRLNAAPAWIALPSPGASAPADCCFHARVMDWLRIAIVLLDDGRFEGKSVVPPGWVERMRRPVSADGAAGFGIELAAAAHGAERFAADDAFFLRGPGHWRLWLIPSLQLAVLFGASAAGGDAAAPWDETRLPNLVIRALSEPAAQRSVGSQLQQLVPGH
jgi:hypothetical protein